MYAITARYAGPTDYSGSRYIVNDGYSRSIQSYDYAANDPDEVAIRNHVERFSERFRYIIAAGHTLTFGTLPDGGTVAVWT